MYVLAIDTSTRMGSVALLENEDLLAQIQLNVEATHTERLLPAIDILLQQTGRPLSQVSGLAVSIGPGSFTGLRIGLATAKGFAQSLNIPLVGISSLLALSHNGCFSDIPVVALMDAKRKEVYAACYRFHRGGMKEILLEETAISPDVLCNTLKTFGPCLLVGDGAKVYQKLFEELLQKAAIFAPSPATRLEAKWIGLLGLEKLKAGEGKDWQRLTPNYLRLSDAELKT